MTSTMKLRDMIFAAMMVALGIVIPMSIHSLNVSQVVLPMHLPVLVGGFILPWPLALLVGVLTPVLSSLLTSMPPLMPMLPIMVVELATYGMAASVLYHKAKWHPLPTLLVTMVAGRLVASVMVWLLVQFLGIEFLPPMAFFISSITTGLPGIIIQLILVPLILAMIPDRVRKRHA